VPLRPHQLVDPLTRTADLFVLAHLGVPRVDAATWSMAVDGLARKPLMLDLAGLRRYPRRTVTSFHECAGNPLTPEVPRRRIANVVWAGADLRDVLEDADPDPSAAYVWSYGLDGGTFAGVRADRYLKDLPLRRVDEGGVLIAYELNGEPLPAEHGFPARLFVPGWYGTNCVKWLSRLELHERRAGGPFTTIFYNDLVPAGPGDAEPCLRPVWEVAPESVIVGPEPEARVTFGREQEVWGWAWAGAGVARVEVSVDGGHRWREADLGPRRQWSWRRFRFGWRPDRLGDLVLASRATDPGGRAQPPSGARNAIHEVPVTVSPATPLAQDRRGSPR
jgi:DMSO/TMAO reductase YedYZ molybdopterin-dependent catalytic subunit